MAPPRILTTQDFVNSIYADLAEDLDNALLVLSQAEDAIQAKLGRTIGVQSYTERFRPTSNTLFVRERPIVSVTSIKRRWSVQLGWTNLDLSYVTFESGPGYIDPGVNVKGSEVEVVYSAGFATVPEDLKQAMILQAVLFSSPDFEVISGVGDSKEPGIGYISRMINELIAPYRATPMVYH